jgi:hypothetical protein
MALFSCCFVLTIFHFGHIKHKHVKTLIIYFFDR